MFFFLTHHDHDRDRHIPTNKTHKNLSEQKTFRLSRLVCIRLIIASSRGESFGLKYRYIKALLISNQYSYYFANKLL